MKQKLNDKEKLSQILTFFGLNFSDFATKIGVPNAKIYDVSSERIKFFGRETMEQIAKSCPEISPYWLITGEGSMLGGTVEQHNVNGDNLNMSEKSTIPVSVFEKIADTNASLAETNASQQQSIRDLIQLIKHQ
jgi:predicted transcriptional regulator